MLHWKDVLAYADQGNPSPHRKITKSEAEWRERLSDEAFNVTRKVTRKKATERPFRSDMCGLFEPGGYACLYCQTPLFDTRENFDPGSGWPSFTQALKENGVAYHSDHSHDMVRIDTLCKHCGAHRGHVFSDGPPPAGLRDCINAVALELMPWHLK